MAQLAQWEQWEQSPRASAPTGDLRTTENHDENPSKKYAVFGEHPILTCFWCRGPLPPPKGSKPRKFCSVLCRDREWRWRHGLKRRENPYEDEEPPWLLRAKRKARGLDEPTTPPVEAPQSPKSPVTAVTPEPAPADPAANLRRLNGPSPRRCVRCGQPAIHRFCSARCRYGN